MSYLDSAIFYISLT